MTEKKKTEQNVGFIKNHELLKESSQVDDQLNIQFKINDFQDRLESIDNIAMIGLVGDFGTGKSTMLYQIEKKINVKDVLWFNFDAWKYPDRKHLWDGFILDLALLVGKQDDTLGEIEARSILDIFDGFTGINVLTNYLKKVNNQMPVTRIFEYEEILTKLLNSLKQKKIYIVLEDVDRADKEGCLFLETLRQFLNNLKTNKKIVIVVPIGTTSYITSQDSYQKCFDYIDFFNLRKIDLTNFIKKMIKKEFLEGYVLNRFVSWLNYVIKEKKISMRMLKQILRRANLSYIRQSVDGYSPCFEITIAFEVAKHFENKIFEEKQIDRNSDLHLLLFNIFNNNDSIYKADGKINKNNKNTKLLTCKDDDYDARYSKPSINSNPFVETNGELSLADFYLDY